MHIMMYHQLNPILAALFVAGLSGAAITAELGELRANQAIDHLAAMGIDPYGFFVLPRLLGMIVSLLILGFWLNIGVTFGAAVMLNVYQNIPLTVFFRVCVLGLTCGSLALTVGMVVMQAIHIALVQTLRAFRVRAYVDIPRALPGAIWLNRRCACMAWCWGCTRPRNRLIFRPCPAKSGCWRARWIRADMSWFERLPD
jgi:hypothetical protein